jgi:hypothetical protein
MDVLDLHARTATALTLYLAVLGVWGVVLGVAGSGPTPSYRGALVIVEVAILAQGLLGVIAWPARGPADAIHVLYGLALALALPLIASIVREGSPRRAALSLGVGSFFAAGLAVRGITTG